MNQLEKRELSSFFKNLTGDFSFLLKHLYCTKFQRIYQSSLLCCSFNAPAQNTCIELRQFFSITA